MVDMVTLLGRALENKLDKLVIKSYRDIQLHQLIDTLEVMYNPAEIPLGFSASYQESRLLNRVTNPQTFVEVRPGTLDIPLIFDAQLPSDDFVGAQERNIDVKLMTLKKMCGMIDDKTLETRYLKLQWGKFTWMGAGYFAGRMQQLSVRYTLFDRDGTPLRASVSLSLIEDRDPERVRSELGIASHAPSVMRVIGDMSLDALSQHLTGSVDNVLELAEQNGLDVLGKVKAGAVVKWLSHKGK